jgi:hypothetical protein
VRAMKWSGGWAAKMSNPSTDVVASVKANDTAVVVQCVGSNGVGLLSSDFNAGREREHCCQVDFSALYGVVLPDAVLHFCLPIPALVFLA